MKTVYALAKAFVVPSLGGPRAVDALNYMDAIGSIQKTALQKLKLGSSKISGRGMVVRASGDAEEGPSAKTFITIKGGLLMEDLRSRLKSHKEKVAKLEKQLSKHGRAQTAAVKKLRLKVAKEKMAQLASMLLLWQTGRTKEIRTAVVNKEGGSLQVLSLGGGSLQLSCFEPCLQVCARTCATRSGLMAQSRSLIRPSSRPSGA